MKAETDTLTLKGLWGGGAIKLTPPCRFSKNVSSKDRVKPCILVTFNISISHIFPENFIEIPQII